MKFALFALVASASAVRFYGQELDLSSQEEEHLIKPTLIANGAMPEVTNMRRTFSQGLSDLNSGAVHWDTQFRAGSDEFKNTNNEPVMQPSVDALTKSDQMELVKQANDELEVRHTAPLPDAAKPVAAPIAKSKKELQYDAEMKNRMFPAFHDDKDMGDSRINADMLHAVGV